MRLGLCCAVVISCCSLTMGAGYQDTALSNLMAMYQYDQLFDEETRLLRALSGAKQGGYGGGQEGYNYHDTEYGDYGYDYPQERSGGGGGGGGYGYGYQQQQQSSGGYGHQMSSGYGESDGYGHNSGGYGYQMKKKKMTYKPIPLPQKKEKKMKIISIDKGFYIPGGTQMFGKFKSLKGCMKACATTPNCFAGDYNPWFGRCYLHSNITACGTLRAHKKLTHFKKVPCTVPEAPTGLIVLGAQLFKALEQKGLDSLTDCLKKCATAGAGIQPTYDLIADQICFGIDYDFGTHKCYFHVANNGICLGDAVVATPRDLVANPSTIFIALCPDPAPV